MVMDNRGTPDPENPSGNLSPNHEFIMANDTDTDDEDNPNSNDYQPLPTDDAGAVFNSLNFQALANGDCDVDDDGNDIETYDEETGMGLNVPQETTPVLPPIVRAETEIVGQVWAAGPGPKAVDIEMDSTKVDEVKQVMRSITLPPESIPEWATDVPEEQWKERLMSRLEDLKKGD